MFRHASATVEVVRALLQRATTASVTIDDEVVGALPRPGLVALVGVTHTDTRQHAELLADKIWGLRILDGERAARDVDAPLLIVSQFTLYADIRKGRRPSWSVAAPRDVSEPLIDHLVDTLSAVGAEVSTGRFGAHMDVRLVNDGPVTILVDTDTWLRT